MKPASAIQFEHGGDLEGAARFAGCGPEQLLDFSNLLNPCGPPPGLAKFLGEKAGRAIMHPSSGEDLREKIAGKMGVSIEQILLGAGTTEFIRLLPWVKRFRRPLILGPTYGDYEKALRLAGADPAWVMALEAENFIFPRSQWEKALEKDPDVVFLARPNNPLGQTWPLDFLYQAMENHPDIFFVVDETCLEISEDPSRHFLARPLPSNLAVLRSFSKTYAAPGLRLGYMVVPALFAGLFREAQMPWSVTSLALEAGAWLLDQEAWLSESRVKNTGEKKRVDKKFSSLKKFKVFPSSITAFTLKGLAPGFSSQALLQDFLTREKILVRSLGRHPGLGDAFFRVGLRSPQENDRLLAALERLDD